MASDSHMTVRRPDPLTDRRAVNAVEAVFLNKFDWVFREQTVRDFGIDAQADRELLPPLLMVGQSHLLITG